LTLFLKKIKIEYMDSSRNSRLEGKKISIRSKRFWKERGGEREREYIVKILINCIYNLISF